MTDKNVTIVGLGLMGGSLAKTIKNFTSGLVFAVDRDAHVLAEAKRTLVIDEGFIDATVPLRKSELVVLCLYPSDVIAFLEKYHQLFKKDAVITDFSGIKTKIKDAFLKYPHLRYVGTHPMAGREYSSYAAALPELYLGTNFIVCQDENTDIAAMKLIEEMAYAIGVKNVVKVSAKEHDRLVSFTSHLPHIIAGAVCNMEEIIEADNFTGGSFESLTRVAKFNLDLWTELLCENEDNAALVDHLIKQLVEIRELMKNKDKDGILTFLKNAKSNKERL